MRRPSMRCLLLSWIALCALLASGAQAASITTLEFGNGSDSLHGATGFLRFEPVDSDTTRVFWGMDTTGFDDANATSTGHTLLSHIAFKVSGITGVTLMDPSLGTVNFPSNVNNGGCSSGSPASFVCLTLDDPIDVITDRQIEVGFLVEGGLNTAGEVSYRGKFGPRNGWVISEKRVGEPPIPEPSSAAVFALGALVVGFRLRRRA